MITGISFCNWAYERLQKHKADVQKKREVSTESFSQDDAEREKMRIELMEGAQNGLVFVIYMISLAFLIMELLLMFYALKLSLKCSKPGLNRVAHVSMAFFFTFPYILMSLFFSSCDAL